MVCQAHCVLATKCWDWHGGGKGVCGELLCATALKPLGVACGGLQTDIQTAELFVSVAASEGCWRAWVFEYTSFATKLPLGFCAADV